ncbi:von Willebrand factor A domain-containing protein 7-like [Hippoglossus hippoglossus]|uniref:von Willebrand factor A domain-containing protein 7-like n=1 Tax=Hippoglossus hippoglossus TaxID=8267 RepID=UPI00148BCA53|nr:von Willebrand factor A domain-containing protein 7-like [Hippoglossus hippoglossus]
MGWLAALCLVLLQTGAHAFDIFDGDSLNHQEITERAILETTLGVCRDVALAAGKKFTSPTQPYTAESVARACDASKSSKSFSQTIEFIQDKNVGIDKRYFYSARHHFDNEEFTKGKRLITNGLSAVKANNKLQNFEAARKNVGRLLHSLQDFYSHSNWVEMGETNPNSKLIKPGSIGKTAAKSRATCRSCNGDDCRNNILEDILREKILTTGYFEFLPGVSKPNGKCSHGGGFDRTSSTDPTGGINKDTTDSEHGHFHFKAANMAIAATRQVLEDIRRAAGDATFLQLMGINKGKALCFVIDTTGSMRDDIAAVRTVTSAIINSRVGTEDEPSAYILVPFNDPAFGPLTRTTDPEVFKRAINSLTATGGGDFPEMSLSGLRLALTGAPPGSDIFLFTDAPAKDDYLLGAVITLVERTKSVVNFMITGSLGFRRRRESNNTNDQQQQQQPKAITKASSKVYADLAQASGGVAIQTTKSQLLAATTIVTGSSSSAQVLLLQAARSPGKSDNFTFTVDESVKNLTIYINGRSVAFTLISPSGVSQSSTNLTGPLISSTQSVGNFQTLELTTQVGPWEIRLVSTNPYTLKVKGESSIDFLSDFLEVSEGPLGGFEVLENRPRAGANASLRVTVTGDVSAVVETVFLVVSLTSERVNGSVEALGKGKFLARFDNIPSGEFVVLVKGHSSNTSSRATASFQRQTSNSIRASAVTVSADDLEGVLEPGVPLSVPFSVLNNGSGGSFTIQATNDQGFTLSFPSTLPLTAGSRANGTVNITAPASTASGTDVTLTIEANAPGGTDANYVVLRLTVLIPVTDFTEPECQLLNLQSNCSANCSASMWELSVVVTDGVNGTGIDTISFREGNGTMNTSLLAGNATLVSYNASCCSPDVEIVVVDQVGNVGSCSYTVRTTTPTVNTTTTTAQPATTTAASAQAVQSFLLCLSITILGLSLPI